MRSCFTCVALSLVVAESLAAQAGAGPGRLPAVPLKQGPLVISVAHPAAGAAIVAGDSTFLFGSVGDGSAIFTVAGQPVPVAPNGAWLAWVALPPDSVVTLALVARRGDVEVHDSIVIKRAGWVRRAGAWVDRQSFSPSGDLRLPVGEAVPIAVRAVPRANVRLLFPDGRRIALVSDSLAPGRGSELYLGVFEGSTEAAAAPTVLASWPPATSGMTPILEVVLGQDTTRLPWPIRVARLPASVPVVLDDDPTATGRTDRTTIGRGLIGGSYSWFFPQGTRTRADARIGDALRLQLGGGAIAWVSSTDVQPAPDDRRIPVMGSLVVSRDTVTGITALRIPLTRPVPMRVDEEASGLSITLFGAVGDVDWIRHAAASEFIRALTWTQETADRVVVRLQFSTPLWGWRSRVRGTDLMFEFREPPRIDRAHPLKGRHIVIDPGHPPAGACGPTGLCEPQANLEIALRAKSLLEAQGARVTLTRHGMEPVDLWPRVALADSINADVLISIHNNALPDGVNPATTTGTSTFYNHLAALPLARAVQQALVARLGQRDLGVALGDLALVRPAWYPSILTEGLFLMIPAQEAALRSAEGQRQYAAGVVDGLMAFLRTVATVSTNAPLNRLRR